MRVAPLTAALFVAFLTVAAMPAAYSSADSPVQARIGQFNLTQQRVMQLAPPTRVAARQIASDYNRLIAPLQSPAKVRRFDTSAIQTLYSTAYDVQFMTAGPQYVRDMEMDLGALERAHAAGQVDYIDLEQALIIDRSFVQAEGIAKSHPGSVFETFRNGRTSVVRRESMTPVPEFIDGTKGTPTHTELLLTKSGSLVRRNVDLHSPAQIIVVISPECHFAQGGLHDLLSDSQLGSIFERNSTWITPAQELGFDEIRAWNTAHPHAQMAVAYDEKEWPMLDTWETPTFYFLEHGKVLAEVVGWPRGGRKTQIRAALKRVGLL